MINNLRKIITYTQTYKELSHQLIRILHSQINLPISKELEYISPLKKQVGVQITNGLFGTPISGHFDHFESSKWPEWPNV